MLWVTHLANDYYFAATTSGLYSTKTLAGDATEWSLESPDLIGNTLVTHLSVDHEEGRLAVATFGRGIFSKDFELQNEPSLLLTKRFDDLEGIKPAPQSLINDTLSLSDYFNYTGSGTVSFSAMTSDSNALQVTIENDQLIVRALTTDNIDENVSVKAEVEELSVEDIFRVKFFEYKTTMEFGFEDQDQRDQLLVTGGNWSIN